MTSPHEPTTTAETTAVATTEPQPENTESESTAVATTRGVGILPDNIRAAIQMRKAQNMAVAQLAGTNWGKGMDLETRRATAQWGQDNNVDVITEIDVLGGKVYLNAVFYLNRCSEMIANGIVQYAVVDHVEIDPRLAKIAAAGGERGARAQREIERREDARIEYQLPDNAVSAVVYRVKLHHVATEFTGAKWCGGRAKDPVGNEFPVETSETRAARRCLRKLVNHVPKVGQYIKNIEDDAELRLNDALRAGLTRMHADIAEAQRVNRPATMASIGAGYDAQPAVDIREQGRSVPILVVNAEATPRMPAAELAKLADAPDPYGEHVPPVNDFDDNRYADEPKSEPANAVDTEEEIARQDRELFEREQEEERARNAAAKYSRGGKR